jgi:glyoxylase-like metal-dependent hydrolase (beta-lactamase superfamily II)
MPDRPGVRVDLVRFARVPTPYTYVFRPPGRGLGRWWSTLRPGENVLDGPCLFYVLHHEDAGTILVDTGLSPADHENLADFGTFLRLAIFRGLEPVGPPFGDGLADHGVDLESVRQVVMTHLHVDHTSGMKMLPNARFTCSRREWKAAGARGSAGKGYSHAHLPDASKMDLIDIEAAGEPFGPFPHTHDLLGDGSIRLLSTPGHAPGHLSVLVHDSDHGDVLIVGDAAYTLRSIDEQILPLITDDDAAAQQTLRRLREFGLSNPDVPLIPSHDPEAWKAWPPLPATTART